MMRTDMTIQAIGLNQVKQATNKISLTLMPLVQKFFKTNSENLPYHITIRSSVIKITTTGRYSNADFFNKPLTIGFNFNRVWSETLALNITNIGDFMCLGILVNNSWTCGSRLVTKIYS
jgi:hypothetical protein